MNKLDHEIKLFKRYFKKLNYRLLIENNHEKRLKILDQQLFLSKLIYKLDGIKIDLTQRFD